MEPFLVSCLCNRAAAYMSVKRYQEALDDAYTAMSIDSSNPNILYQVFQAYTELDDRQTAESLDDFNRYLSYQLTSAAKVSPLIGSNLAVLRILTTDDAEKGPSEGPCHMDRTEFTENGHTNQNPYYDTARDVNINTVTGKGCSRRGEPLLKKEDEDCAAQMIRKKLVERGNANTAGRAIQDVGQTKRAERYSAAIEVPAKALKARTASRDAVPGKRRVKSIERSTQPRIATETLPRIPEKAAQDAQQKKQQEGRRAKLIQQEQERTERGTSRRGTDERRRPSTERIHQRRTRGEKRRPSYYAP